MSGAHPLAHAANVQLSPSPHRQDDPLVQKARGLLLVLLAAFLPAIGAAADSSRFLDPHDGQLDLSAFLENPGAFLPIPLVITEPAVGYGGGLAGVFFRPRREAGSQGWARPNMSVLGAVATENATQAAFGGDSSRWFEGRLKTLAGGGIGRINLDFYGPEAGGVAPDEPVRYSLDFDLALMQGNWLLAPKSRWSGGLRYLYARVDPRLRDDAFADVTGQADVTISAPAAIVEFDSRDNIFTPTRGVFAESVLLVSRQDLGASEDFERFQQVLMSWFALAAGVTLGVRGDYQQASDETPFFYRPYVKLRGVPAMRFQGDEMASVEAEVRWQFRDRWSAVAAAGYGATRSGGEVLQHEKEIASGALGLRYVLARRFGLHAGMDLGFSSEATAVYFQLGNAWFRP
jgi:hypothetical protein